jgi:lantibiotic modifying enzyme
MSEPDNILDTPQEPPAKGPPWAVILVIAVFVGMTFLAFWVNHEKKNRLEREATMSVLDKELVADESAVKAQREKVQDLTKQVEELRTRIQTGGVKDGKAAIAEFNKLAADQRAEREKFIQMADQYNQKVAKYRQLEQ